MSTSTLTVRIKSLDHRLADDAARQLVALARAFNVEVRGPIPLPVSKGKLEPQPSSVGMPSSQRGSLYKRELTLSALSEDAIAAITHVSLPAGVQTQVSVS